MVDFTSNQRKTRISRSYHLLPSVSVAPTVFLIQNILRIRHPVSRIVTSLLRLHLHLYLLWLRHWTPPCGLQDLRLLVPTSLSNDAPELLTEEHVRMLQQFFNFAISELSSGFADTPADLACQLWDLIEAHCAQREYACPSPNWGVIKNN